MAVTEVIGGARIDLAGLSDAVESLCASAAALPVADGFAEQLRLAEDAYAVDVLDRLGRVRRQVDALLATAAAVIDRRSRPELGTAGLARSLGNRNGADLIAELVQVSPAEAASLVRVGCAATGDVSIVGEQMPPQSPAIAAALSVGDLGIAHANEVVRFRKRVEGRADAREVDAAEAQLVDLAVHERFRMREFQRVIARMEAHIDPDGAVPDLTWQREFRSVTYRTLPSNGMFELKALLDAESGAFVRQAIDVFTTTVLRASRGSGAAPSGGGVEFRPVELDDEATTQHGVVPETRSIAQLQADALVECCKHLLGCDLATLPGPASKVVFRMHVNDLEASDFGPRARVGEIDGGGLLRVADVRRRAAAAGVIPVVLGGESEVLDQGRERRHFTPAQRLALVERDGGCAMCGLPPGLCEAHHLRWWARDGGNTDLDNGVLLCSRCHHLVHEGWDLTVERGTVWVTPPRWVDPTRTPQVGGRKRFDPTYGARMHAERDIG